MLHRRHATLALGAPAEYGSAMTRRAAAASRKVQVGMNGMAHRLLVVLALLASLGAGGCRDKHPGDKGDGVASSKPNGAGPKIVALEPTFAFGKVKQGADVEHVFKIRNEGTADLVIDKAKGS